MNTILSWLATNWSDMVKWIVIGGAGYYLISVHNDLRKAEQDNVKWEQTYKTTADNLVTMKSSYDTVVADRGKLETKLVEREADVQRLNTNLSTARNQISKLRSENEKIRDLLSTTVPNELWEQIFPRGSANGDGSGQDKSVQGTASTVSTTS